MTSDLQTENTEQRRKFLAVIDETPECKRAVAYASRRAKNSSGTLVLLFVIDSSDFQHILGVGDVMRAEAEERAKNTLSKVAAEVREDLGIEAERIVREGQAFDELIKLIEEDHGISLLILAASANVDGPGPLVQSIIGRNVNFPIPITVVPSNLSDDDIEALA